jgi:AraC-like DNA-binding protein
MSSTRERLSEIALGCGFTDQPYFNLSFRRIVGASPGQWRRNLGSTGT